jgi:hypothetical protein
MAKCLPVNGERGRIRTCDPRLKRALLYQLSYAPTLLQSITANLYSMWHRRTASLSEININLRLGQVAWLSYWRPIADFLQTG